MVHYLRCMAMMAVVARVPRGDLAPRRRRHRPRHPLTLIYLPGRLDANGGQISGFCGHTFHLHIVYLRALLVRNRRLFFRICFVASCEMAVAGRTGPNAVGIMPKVHDMWVNSLAALLGALAAIRSEAAASLSVLRPCRVNPLHLSKL